MWIRTARPPQRLRLDAVRINRWLLGTTGHPQPVIAREERSLHIFNDEKRLAHLTGGALFAPGRLRLEHLACQPPAGNIGAARLGPHGAVLVVENKSTFDSAWRAQRAADQPTYAAIILGNGDAASTLVADLSQLEELLGVQATTVHYAGDVDIAGIEAAHAFTTAADAAGLEATAATPLWDAVARAEPTGDDLTGHTTSKDSAIDTAKRLKLPSSVISRLEQGVRVPQERVDRTALSRTECGDPRPSQPWFRDRRTSARFDGRSAAELHHLVDQANFACPAKQQPPRLGPASATTAPTRPLRAPRWATAAGRHLPSVAESCAGRMASVGRR
ncbi:hypothetical protein ACGFIW_23640 [Micromonospora sp. NPDC048935]|uniref:hypothetical protein n=1 Tax=Micromonospora sp. NPDC048935 TaxID=3364262 RepID=UPI00371A3C44